MNPNFNIVRLLIIRKFSVVVLILLIGVMQIPIINASAMNGGSYQLPQSTIDGGGTTSSGGQYVLVGTIAQPDASWMAADNYELIGGFWPETPACIVNLEDFAVLAGYWLEIGTGLPADLYEDGVVDTLDLEIFVNEWLGSCPRGWPLSN